MKLNEEDTQRLKDHHHFFKKHKELKRDMITNLPFRTGGKRRAEKKRKFLKEGLKIPTKKYRGGAKRPIKSIDNIKPQPELNYEKPGGGLRKMPKIQVNKKKFKVYASKKLA